MEQSIGDWCNWLLAAGRSEATVAGYRWELQRLAAAFPKLGPFDYRLSDLNRFQAERRLSGIGDQARKRSVAAQRSFFRYICGRKSPAAALPAPKVKRRAQRVLDWDQAGAVLATCETTTAKGLRDLALLCLLIESGLRAAEVCRLEVAKLDLTRRRLSVVTKGGHEGVGAFDALTAEYLAGWLQARAAIALPDCRTVFCSVGGLTRGGPLTPRGLRQLLAGIGKAAGLPAGLSPHDLRRSCATLKTRLGAPSRVVQVGGRWANLREVERYTATISLDDFAGYSPVGHLLGR